MRRGAATSRFATHRPAWFTGLWLGWLAVLMALAAWQRAPGYMDEAYYWVVGRAWAAGQGLVEPFLWNYLDDPAGLPHPAGAYWQPLPALLAGLFHRVGARWGFVLLAAAVPWLTWGVARAWGFGGTGSAWAGLWAMAAGFYLAYLPAVDGFAPLLVLGGLYWALLPGAWRDAGRGAWRWAALGALAAGVHLTRAEGVLWLLATLAAALGAGPGRTRRLTAVLLGYALLMAPWWARNLQVWGRLWPPGQSRALWLTEYNDLFRYPAAQLTPQRWLAQGWGKILRDRAWALGLNLQTTLAVHGSIVLLPFVLLAGWRARQQPALRVAVGLYLAVLGLMTVVFPFAGARGGWFHAGAGFQPLLWALAGEGFETGLTWAARRRGWHRPSARRVLGGGLTLLLLAMTAALTWGRVQHWNADADRYAAAWRAWQQMAPQNAQAGPVLVVNPPLWVWVTGEPALVTPTGGPGALTAVAQRYGAVGLVLEANHPPGLAAWWVEPGPRPNWRYLGAAPGVQLYAFALGSR